MPLVVRCFVEQTILDPSVSRLDLNQTLKDSMPAFSFGAIKRIAPTVPGPHVGECSV